ncbi:hypothetical protein FHG66_03740 [Rubellimicrobium rubrum]|uniref:TadE-like domain-containing protein n=1 Tax=Rubellimicrobium rubrum TaxID=2585369 RepID=A0A5C4N367_9RHOB|nr:TadE/TadG family type IV pilus assembly protein [Rubellimicrobium rubrum]TNC51932.1 hypothetical protein FHG66_03740 [Rubellimicrobium rubrum]
MTGGSGVMATLGWLTRFARSEDGSVTVEAVLWLPVFFGLLVMITDASLAFYGRGEAYRVLQNGNRAFATGRLDSPAATKRWIESTMETVAPNASVETKVNADRTIVVSRMSIPVSDLSLFNMFEGFDMVVQSEHYVE